MGGKKNNTKKQHILQVYNIRIAELGVAKWLGGYRAGGGIDQARDLSAVTVSGISTRQNQRHTPYRWYVNGLGREEKDQKSGCEPLLSSQLSVDL